MTGFCQALFLFTPSISKRLFLIFVSLSIYSIFYRYIICFSRYNCFFTDKPPIFLDILIFSNRKRKRVDGIALLACKMMNNYSWICLDWRAVKRLPSANANKMPTKSNPISKILPPRVKNSWRTSVRAE